MNSKTASTPDKLITLQEQFAAHIRNPEQAPAPADVEDRRMSIYRNLFFSNVRSLLSWNFPVLKKIFSEEQWTKLVRDFYVEHRARTPLFPELPREFLQYLQDQRSDRDGDPPFMLELAHYEWVEKALSMDEAEIDDTPVHEIKPDNKPQSPPETPTHLLVYRNRDDDVRFMRLNAVSALLLQFLKEDNGKTGQEILNEIVTALAHPNPDTVIEGGVKLLEDFRKRVDLHDVVGDLARLNYRETARSWRLCLAIGPAADHVLGILGIGGHQVQGR